MININFYAKRPRLHDHKFLAFLHCASPARRSEESWIQLKATQKVFIPPTGVVLTGMASLNFGQRYRHYGVVKRESLFAIHSSCSLNESHLKPSILLPRFSGSPSGRPNRLTPLPLRKLLAFSHIPPSRDTKPLLGAYFLFFRSSSIESHTFCETVDCTCDGTPQAARVLHDVGCLRSLCVMPKPCA